MGLYKIGKLECQSWIGARRGKEGFHGKVGGGGIGVTMLGYSGYGGHHRMGGQVGRVGK